MVDRRRLTAEVVAGLAPPERGERWVADTELRGFGLRLWAARGGPGAAFAIRVTDREGRKIRRSFSASPGFLAAQNQVCFRSGWDDPSRAPIPFPPPLSLLLDAARTWAREEIQRAKLGESDADRTRRVLAAEADRLGALSLDEAVDEFRRTSRFVGWSEPYRDRLNAAYHNSFPEEFRRRTLRDLGGDVFEQAFEALPISEPQRRLVRGMLGLVFAGVIEQGGPWMDFRRWAPLSIRAHRADRADMARDWLQTLARVDFERLLEALRCSDFGWRACLCLEISLLVRAPASRVICGRWNRVVEDRWYPWGPEERNGWFSRAESIDGRVGQCLGLARKRAEATGIHSVFWFPSQSDPSRPIGNVDRAWFAALQAAGWQRVTLKAARDAFHREYLKERILQRDPLFGPRGI